MIPIVQPLMQPRTWVGQQCCHWVFQSSISTVDEAALFVFVRTEMLLHERKRTFCERQHLLPIFRRCSRWLIKKVQRESFPWLNLLMHETWIRSPHEVVHIRRLELPCKLVARASRHLFTFRLVSVSHLGCILQITSSTE